ncbi:4-vinyl reductase [Lacrimispora sp.]|uniref:4-vinyl reductase n=1 Tax=Lacrimispora sp. TaxID=2719234 RepID=UPI0028B0F659|nr:4-vinyl reductase [Lacrimispora sp.]
MFNVFHVGEEKDFSWSMIGNVAEGRRNLASLQNSLEVHKIGILRIEKFDPRTGDVVLTVGEDLDCSGLPVTGDQVCNYDEGFLSGVLKEYTGKDYLVKEVDCWASGARICRFEANVDQQAKV